MGHKYKPKDRPSFATPIYTMFAEVRRRLSNLPKLHPTDPSDNLRLFEYAQTGIKGVMAEILGHAPLSHMPEHIAIREMHFNIFLGINIIIEELFDYDFAANQALINTDWVNYILSLPSITYPHQIVGITGNTVYSENMAKVPEWWEIVAQKYTDPTSILILIYRNLYLSPNQWVVTPKETPTLREIIILLMSAMGYILLTKTGELTTSEVTQKILLAQTLIAELFDQEVRKMRSRDQAES